MVSIPQLWSRLLDPGPVRIRLDITDSNKHRVHLHKDNHTPEGDLREEQAELIPLSNPLS